MSNLQERDRRRRERGGTGQRIRLEHCLHDVDAFSDLHRREWILLLRSLPGSAAAGSFAQLLTPRSSLFRVSAAPR